MAKRPWVRVNSTRIRENSTPPLLAALRRARRTSALPAATRSSAASPRTMKSRMLRMPSCGVLAAGRRVHRHPHLAAEDLRIGVAEAEQRAGVLGLDIDDVAPAGASAQIAGERRVAPEPRGQREAHDAAVAARHLEIDAAQRFAVEAGDGAEPDVDVDVLELRVLGLARRRAGHRRLDEAAAVIDVAAHRDAQRAVGAALGPQRRLVAVGEVEAGQVRGLDVAGCRRLDRAFDQQCPGPSIERSSKPHELRPAGHDEGHARLPARPA